MTTVADARRRWFGAMFLALAGGLLTWGLTILKPVLAGRVYLVYWLSCFLLTLLAIVIALLDIRAVRRRTRNEQQALLQQTLTEIQKSEKQRPDQHPVSPDKS
jgi:membrane protein implicated in regulation of membrane protease activity